MNASVGRSEGDLRGINTLPKQVIPGPVLIGEDDLAIMVGRNFFVYHHALPGSKPSEQSKSPIAGANHASEQAAGANHGKP